MQRTGQSSVFYPCPKFRRRRMVAGSGVRPTWACGPGPKHPRDRGHLCSPVCVVSTSRGARSSGDAGPASVFTGNLCAAGYAACGSTCTPLFLSLHACAASVVVGRGCRRRVGNAVHAATPAPPRRRQYRIAQRRRYGILVGSACGVHGTVRLDRGVSWFRGRSCSIVISVPGYGSGSEIIFHLRFLTISCLLSCPTSRCPLSPSCSEPTCLEPRLACWRSLADRAPADADGGHQLRCQPPVRSYRLTMRRGVARLRGSERGSWNVRFLVGCISQYPRVRDLFILT
ncbi:hypothetical protein BJ912DRAFT_254184 [Pholiota molesta]|nr:hypothetical protein BJ912DRAFT_254184 [Pholiota molesta]